MRIAVIHGTMGSPQDNWFPWIKEKLEEQNIVVVIPVFPTPDGQNVDNWLGIFFRDVPPPYHDTILIGHSIGATCMLSILESAKESFVTGIFVAPVMDDIELENYNLLNRSFYQQSFDWQSIKQSIGNATILHGDNDPYVPLSHAETLSKKLDVSLRIIPQGGHLNAESGYTTFPELLNIVIPA